MQAEELRLGNWVSNTHGIPMIVKTIGMDYIYVDFKNNPGDLLEFNTYNPFNPIHLTEEILLKCENIIKHPTIKNRYLFEDKKSSFHISDWDNPSLDIFIDGKYIICVEFLHTFQNLIYALTNQELNIEL